MAQRFLLSVAARTLSLRSIYAEGERAAYRRFCALRWPETSGRPICPACGCLDVYDLCTRQRFKCAACRRQFSVTSGTIFGGHVRPANARVDRVDRRLLEHRSDRRRVVVALRQLGGRTLTRTFLREAEGVGFAR